METQRREITNVAVCIGFECSSTDIAYVSKCEQYACEKCYDEAMATKRDDYYHIYCSFCKQETTKSKQFLNHWRKI
jgi:hypothetical protein